MNPFAELGEVILTFAALYGLAVLLNRFGGQRPQPPRPAPVHAARREPPLPAAQDTAPYRGLDGVKFGRADRDHPAEGPQ